MPSQRKDQGRSRPENKGSARRKGKPAARAATPALRPKKLSGKKVTPEREEDGPIGWLLPQLEGTHTLLASRDTLESTRSATAATATRAVSSASSLQPDGKTLLAPSDRTEWRDIMREFKRRKSARAALEAVAPPGPVVPGGVNWLPLGPAVVLNAQTVGEESVGGRVAGLAVSLGGQRVYAASANGGVFRSVDGGTTWRNLMDAFDLDPQNFASTSLACGAIAIDLADPNRVYVGTGEGDTQQLFNLRITNALPSYRGVGPLRSDDGGDHWIPEPSAPDLAGEAFFSLAVDPNNRENVVAATTAGLYQRTPKPGGGGFVWNQRRPGVHASAVVAADGATTQFFAAEWGKGVFTSTNGAAWSAAGTGLPTANVGRIALAVQRTNPKLVYAFVANTSGAVLGVYRLDSIGGSWAAVSGLPDVLPVQNGRSQGDYDIAISVDPVNRDLIYLGGSYANVSPFPGSVWRCLLQASGAAFKVKNSASIGTHAHADVHYLMHTPGDSNELWCTCDGGVFLNRDPQATGQFASQNAGLACLCSNFISQHPTDPGILFTGLQDNGTARTSGAPNWSHVMYGDGGYCLINWADPDRVLVYANGRIYRSMNGGLTHDSWTQAWDFGWATMTQPIVTAPYKPESPEDAEFVAVGAGAIVYVSNDFTISWPASFSINLPGGNATGSVFALAFASTTRLFIGTTRGRVFRADWQNNAWAVTRLDDVSAGPIGLLNGLICDIAVDWADTNLSSVYIAFGGRGDRRRVWRFDGTRWEDRSGVAEGSNLLNVEHNALAVDRSSPGRVFVGADIGVWHSSDGGLHWEPFQNGLPDAPVFDLQIHPTKRLLRAATHGRGVYEIPLD